MTSTGTWYGGGQFVVTNNGHTARDWKLSFSVSDGVFQNHAEWATQAEVHGDHVVITPKDPLVAGGSDYVSFGISGDGTADLLPRACDIDGSDVEGCSANEGGEPGPVDPIDEEAPSTVTGLSTHHSHDDRVHVMWTHASDNVGVDHYELERNGAHLMDVEGTKRMLDVAGHVADTTYSYRVRAVDAAGNAGGWSKQSSVTLPGAPGEDHEAPSAPGEPSISDVTARSAVATWDASTDDVGVVGYTAVLRQDGREIVRRDTTATTTAFTGLVPSTAYTVDITASDAAGHTTTSPAAGFTTSDEIPVDPDSGTPADFNAVADSYQDGRTTMHRVRMTWTPTNGAVERYEIFLDGKRVQTLLVGDQESGAAQRGEQTRFLALGPDDSASGHTVQVRAQLADGTWSAPTPSVTVR